MRSTTLLQRDSSRPLTRAQLQEIRTDLERQRVRFDPSDIRFHALTEALRRIDEGTYGVCAECNERIPHGRLSVMPETLFCVKCGPRQ